jgi:hypothetical protein
MSLAVKVEATLATARVLAEEKTSALLHVGIAGATDLEPGTSPLGRGVRSAPAFGLRTLDDYANTGITCRAIRE